MNRSVRLRSPTAGRSRSGRPNRRAGSANFRVSKLVIRPGQFAEIRPSAGQFVFFGVFLAIGLVTMVAAGVAIPRIGIGGLFPVAIGLVFAAVGWFGLFGRFGPSPITFDLAQGVMTKRGGKMPVPELATGLSLDRLAALQVCSYSVSRYDSSSSHSRSTSYSVYELNAILTEPVGRRFTLISDCARERLMNQGNELARLLGLQLIDNACLQTT